MSLDLPIQTLMDVLLTVELKTVGNVQEEIIINQTTVMKSVETVSTGDIINVMMEIQPQEMVVRNHVKLKWAIHVLEEPITLDQTLVQKFVVTELIFKTTAVMMTT